jgi:hypothetical protein
MDFKESKIGKNEQYQTLNTQTAKNSKNSFLKG